MFDWLKKILFDEEVEEIQEDKLEKIDFTKVNNIDNIVSDEFETDDLGNDVRPVKIEEFGDISADVSDEKGFHSNGFGVALEEGTHTIRLSQVNNGVLIKNLIQ